jgi:tRNA 2-thiouridine synthesizing protein A
VLCRRSYGDRLSVECADPLAVIDIPHLLRETSDTLEREDVANGLSIFHIFHIKRGEA